MVAQAHGAVAVEAPEATLHCPGCGRAGGGRFCSECGTRLRARRASSLWLFLDTFVKLDTLWSWANVYVRLLPRPTKRTLALLEADSDVAAFRFLDTSLFLYLLAAGVAAARSGEGASYQDLAVPALTGLVYTAAPSLFYLFARRTSLVARPFGDFVELTALSLGFALPLLGLMLFAPEGAAAVAGCVALAGLGVYTVRVLARFWELSKKRVLAYLALAWTLAFVVLVAGVVAVYLALAAAGVVAT